MISLRSLLRFVYFLIRCTLFQLLILFNKEILLMSKAIITFQDTLEMVESLPESQQETLVDIIRHRLNEHKRKLLIERIKAAKQEYVSSEVKKGNVADLMKEIT